jgi:hypothetical protein
MAIPFNSPPLTDAVFFDAIERIQIGASRQGSDRMDGVTHWSRKPNCHCQSTDPLCLQLFLGKGSA